ncbi:vacuolar transporter chaperone, putative [Plasmodium berghei]|uniref:Vacuolar transporter chaperone, putative n=2 Tax=Plasmodium berghei TaxID=5821 RepID=A0A509AQY6_PLABA|nr:vacuolar transporter chaperone, putative [Plasmodium berghei ANKA]CXJ24071.1 vacuolar transporter chaperone, putative [Plasmodium berghei]SCM26771.1 vacuolar transporter chaperone, putative [Plasmodium berghei]SCN28629.1 vacuolar transporter chaperone, putative [Plasmodium berghei]SCO62830.1 vacuolar transporter chaperone, putative [Plasmodium berghei]SCO64377.1 vacuolar transporter chaperone, putative [Plasmodium berghei]|eukprot:XP_034424273.1 vacuolar transporter chaperone, putative [Plasmodium berghei ANKA]
MKFRKKLHEEAHPKYRDHYISYKELKNVIKLITGNDTSTYTIKEITTNFGNIRALTGAEYKSPESRFQDILNGELDKINKFSVVIIKQWFKEAEIYYKELKRGNEESIDILNIEKKLNELGNTLIFLEKYKHINFIGFRKITKKFDKHNGKTVSSSFYINVVIKSFFMTFDINFLVYILSICYKYYRDIKNKNKIIEVKENTKDEQYLLNNNVEHNKNVSNSDKIYNPMIIGNDNLVRKDVNIKENNLYTNTFNTSDLCMQTEKNVENTKYIVKLQNLMSAKIEICKHFTFQYYDLKECDFPTNFNNLIDIISTNKIQNYYITVYFDDPMLNTYHNYINQNLQNKNNECIRIRSYIYSKDDDEENIKKTTHIQKFNLYEPSHDDNEKYIPPEKLVNKNLEIKTVNDLYSESMYDMCNNDNIINEKDKFTINDSEFPKKKNNNHITSKTDGSNLVSTNNSVNNIKKYDNITQKNIEKYISEIKEKKLKSYIKSKLNRFHFYDENATGYIDENISYWAHNDKRDIYNNDYSDDEEEDNCVEGDIKSDTDGNLNGTNITDTVNNLNEKKRIWIGNGNKKYSYFDHAIIDISIKEHTDKNIILQLNNLKGVKEIWGYSSFLQGISLFYSNHISTYPHWVVYTHTNLTKPKNIDNSKKKEKKKMKYYSENYNKENCVSNGSNVMVSENMNNYTNGNAQKKKKKKQKKKSEFNCEYKKGITYTGASARIAHQSEVIFRNEIEKNKSFNNIYHSIYDSKKNIHPKWNGNGKYHNNNCNKNYNNSDNNRMKYSNANKCFPVNTYTIENTNFYEPLLDSECDTRCENFKSHSGTIFSFFKRLFFKKKQIVDNKIPKDSVVRVEPKTFFANERTLLQWLNTSVLLSTISITLLNFSNFYGFISGIIMAPVAIFFIIYSFYIYLKRANALINKEPIDYTDKIGPGVLVVTLTFALSTVVILNVYSRFIGIPYKDDSPVNQK